MIAQRFLTRAQHGFAHEARRHGIETAQQALRRTHPAALISGPTDREAMTLRDNGLNEIG